VSFDAARVDLTSTRSISAVARASLSLRFVVRADAARHRCGGARRLRVTRTLDCGI